MRLITVVLASFVAGIGAVSSLMADEKQMVDTKNLMQIIEDYVVTNKGWERGSFYVEVDPYNGEGGFSVVKKNSPLAIGGDQNSFLIKVNLKTGKIIGTFAYQ